MLKFLTHKLRTHSLNEDNGEKVEERDSGTESDDDAELDSDPAPDCPGDYCTDVIMKWNDDVTDISEGVSIVECERGGAGGALPPAPPLPPPPDLLYDHHSSEEELEVINKGVCGGGAPAAAAGESRRRGASSPGGGAPEKRRWAAHHAAHLARPPSSDDDDTKVETPVRFRTSPPLEALKPRRAGAPCACPAAPDGGAGVSAGGAGVSAAGATWWRSPGSPRRRRVALPPPRRHRPALDFDKMQQLKVGGGYVRAWRAQGGPHGELSVFCW